MVCASCLESPHGIGITLLGLFANMRLQSAWSSRGQLMQAGISHQCQCPQCTQGEPSPVKHLHSHMNLLLSTLDERQRRLYAGLESEKLGYGGDRQVALITGMSVHTISNGRRELVQLLPDARMRRPGAGQPTVEKTDPTILAALEQLLE